MEESLLVPTCNYLHVRASGRNKDRTETNREGNLFCYPGDKRFVSVSVRCSLRNLRLDNDWWLIVFRACL